MEKNFPGDGRTRRVLRAKEMQLDNPQANAVQATVGCQWHFQPANRRACLLLALLLAGPALAGPVRIPARTTEKEKREATMGARNGPGGEDPTRAALWAKFQAERRSARPKSAEDILIEIARRTNGPTRHPEWVAAQAWLAVLAGEGDPLNPLAAVQMLERALAEAPAGAEPLVRLLLARAWLDAFHALPAGRFGEEESFDPAAPPPADPKQWRRLHFYQRIDDLLQAALSSPGLADAPLAPYCHLLETPAGMRLSGTLLDFLVQETGRLYYLLQSDGLMEEARKAAAQTGEEAPGVESPALSERAAFAAFRPAGQGPFARACLLFQQWLAARSRQGSTARTVTVDLIRLKFLCRWLQRGLGQEDARRLGERYLREVERLARTNARNEAFSTCQAELARLARERNDQVRALALARQGWARYPRSAGGAECRALMDLVRRAEFTASVDAFTLPEETELRVTYRNCRTLHFRLFTVSPFPKPEKDTVVLFNGVGRPDPDLARRPFLRGSQALPATPDYQNNTVPIRLPGLPPGRYRILLSSDPAFRDLCQIQAASFTATRLDVLFRNVNGELEGFVQDALSSEFRAGATVEAYLAREGSAPQRMAAGQSDCGGHFHLAGLSRPNYSAAETCLILVWSGADTVVFEAWESDFEEEEEPSERTVLLTDRALYRPGQEVRFKGVQIRRDPDQRTCTVVPGRRVSLQLDHQRDTTHLQMEVTAGEFGSFSGSFRLPSGGLPGEWILRCLSPEENASAAWDTEETGAAAIDVEEYRLPRFEVALAPPTEPVRPGAMATLSGTVRSLTDAPLTEGEVTYRIFGKDEALPRLLIRKDFPDDAPDPLDCGKLEITGHAILDKTGRFTVNFPARAAEPVEGRTADDSIPSVRYAVEATVTDAAGETHADSATFLAGPASVCLSPAWDRPLEEGRTSVLSLTATDLSGQPAPVGGNLELWRLRRPVPLHPTLLGCHFWAGPFADPDDAWSSWPRDRLVERRTFSADAAGAATLPFRLPKGLYVAVLHWTDGDGRAIDQTWPVLVLPPAGATTCGLPLASLFAPLQDTVPAGGVFEAIWGTGWPTGRCLLEVLHGSRVILRQWSPPGVTCHRFRIPVDASLQGGFALRAVFVRGHRRLHHEGIIRVPWSTPTLALSGGPLRPLVPPGGTADFEVRADGLSAGQRAEVAVTLYDAALDLLKTHSPHGADSLFGQRRVPGGWSHTNYAEGLWPLMPPPIQGGPGECDRRFQSLLSPEFRRPDYLDQDILDGLFQDEFRVIESIPLRQSRRAGGAIIDRRVSDGGAGDMVVNVITKSGLGPVLTCTTDLDVVRQEKDRPVRIQDLAGVRLRRNRRETAAFLPQLVTDHEGKARFSVELPEVATRWTMLALAHTTDGRLGVIRSSLAAATPLVVQPVPPRFLREGDCISFPTRLLNQSDSEMSGTVRLDLHGPSGEDLAIRLGLTQAEQPFRIPAHAAATVAWPLRVSRGLPAVTFAVRAAAGADADGEEGSLPVLPDRVPVTESLPLAIRGPGERTGRFEGLSRLLATPGAEALGLRVEIVTHPIWAAVQALPFLTGFPHECAEQLAERLFAAQSGLHLLSAHPELARATETGRRPAALGSAATDPDRRGPFRSAGKPGDPALFLRPETLWACSIDARAKLEAMQLPSGAWPWFPGGAADEGITVAVVAALGRAQAWGDGYPMGGLRQAAAFLDTRWREAVRPAASPSPRAPAGRLIELLYARSGLIEKFSWTAADRADFHAWLNERRAEGWARLGGPARLARLAVACRRLGERAAAEELLESLRQLARTDDEGGTWWSGEDTAWGWEGMEGMLRTQAAVLEAFREIGGKGAVPGAACDWLLRQKRTRAWGSTLATAEVVARLLDDSGEPLADGAPVLLALGGLMVTAPPGEETTGAYQFEAPAAAITPALADLRLRRDGPGTVWGSVHADFLVPLETLPAGGAVRLTKRLLVRREENGRMVLVPLAGPFRPGDVVTVRLEVEADRDLDHVHLRDLRAAGLESVKWQSGGRAQDGVWCYETHRDTATDFYLDTLPRGRHVIDYELRAMFHGTFRTGHAELECMYAPVFAARSASLTVEVE